MLYRFQKEKKGNCEFPSNGNSRPSRNGSGNELYMPLTGENEKIYSRAREKKEAGHQVHTVCRCNIPRAR